jgi:hypothetical protein
VTGNEKKFKALVTDFVSTTADLGGVIDPEVVATELRQRIQFIAAQIGVTEATVLRAHMPDDWGRDMARQAYRQIQERDAHIDAAPDQQLPLPAVGRLIAALARPCSSPPSTTPPPTPPTGSTPKKQVRPSPAWASH